MSFNLLAHKRLNQQVTFAPMPRLMESMLKDQTFNFWQYIIPSEAGIPKALENADALPRYALPPAIKAEPILGIEVEVENLKFLTTSLINTPPPGWSVKPDGSLREGMEFVSTALTLEETRIALTGLYEWLRLTTISEPDFSWRTSIHVHLNVRELTPLELVQIPLLYSVIEEVLFHYGNAARWQSAFCTPLRNSSIIPNLQAMLSLQTNPVIPFILATKGWHKYSALNIGRLTDLGTLEFRQFRGTDNVNAIWKWVNTVAALFNASQSISIDELKATVQDLNTTSQYGNLLYRMLGPDVSGFYPITPETIPKLSAGVSFVKRVFLNPSFPQMRPYSQARAFLKRCFEQAEESYTTTMKDLSNPLAKPNVPVAPITFASSTFTSDMNTITLDDLGPIANFFPSNPNP